MSYEINPLGESAQPDEELLDEVIAEYNKAGEKRIYLVGMIYALRERIRARDEEAGDTPPDL